MHALNDDDVFLIVETGPPPTTTPKATTPHGNNGMLPNNQILINECLRLLWIIKTLFYTSRSLYYTNNQFKGKMK